MNNTTEQINRKLTGLFPNNTVNQRDERSVSVTTKSLNTKQFLEVSELVKSTGSDVDLKRSGASVTLSIFQP